MRCQKYIKPFLIYILFWSIPLLLDLIGTVGIERFIVSEVIRTIAFYQVGVAFSAAFILALTLGSRPVFGVACILAWVGVFYTQKQFDYHFEANFYSFLISLIIVSLIIRKAARGILLKPIFGRIGAIAWLVFCFYTTNAGNSYNQEREKSISFDAVPKNKNVIVVVVDTMRADDSILNRESNWHNFFQDKRAFVFSNAYSPASGTAPSVKSILTGKSPSYWGRQNISKPPPVDEETLVSHFLKEGYRTGGFTANSLINGGGFSDDYMKYLALGGYNTIRQSALVSDLILGREPISSLSWAEKNSLHKVDGALITKLGLEWVRENLSDNFFLYLHLMDPHWPYRNLDKTPSEKLSHVDMLSGRVDVNNVDAGLLSEMRSRYLGEIEYSYEILSTFLKELEAIGVLEDTLVVVLGDHGEEFFEHDKFSHGHDVYQEQVHVPLLLIGGGINNEGLDVVETPTSLTYLKSIINSTLSEESLSHNSYVLSESFPRNQVNAVYRENNYVVRLEYGQDNSPLETIAVSVFDLDKDPVQQASKSSLNSFEKKLVSRAREALHERWLLGYGNGNGKAAPSLGVEGLDSLKELGYIDD